MTKINRTFRLDEDLSKKLNDITVPPYTYTWHLQKALEAYLAKFKDKPCNNDRGGNMPELKSKRVG